MNQCQNYINGTWIDGADINRNISPSDLSDVVGEYARADRAQAEGAIAAAKSAFPSWSVSSPQTRHDILDAVGSEILARKQELGTLLAREEGKVLPEAIGEVMRAGLIFKFFAGEALRLMGERVDSVRPGVIAEMTREPVGVVAIITPWNFPIAIPAWKIAPALAYGNCVVFKPAEIAPGCGWALAEILSRVGLPEGVFNLVMGKGRPSAMSSRVHPPSTRSVSPVRSASANVSRPRRGHGASRSNWKWAEKIRWSFSTMPTSTSRSPWR